MFIIAPFIPALIGLWVISHLKFPPVLSPPERSSLNFSYEPVPITPERRSVEVSSAVSPIPIVRAAPAASAFPVVPLSKAAPAPATVQPEARVTFILINEDRKMAIVNDKVVSEGDVIGAGKILKIETKRVLMKNNGGETWQNLR